MRAEITAKHKRGKTVFEYRGNLRECVANAEKELAEKKNSTEWLFLKWQYEKSKKAYDTFNIRMKDLNDFIELAKKQFADEEVGKDEREDHDGGM